MREIILFYTNDCNAECPHCFISPLKKVGIRIMPTNICSLALQYAAYSHIHRIVFSGGEPMCHFTSLISSLQELNYDDNIKFSLCTNGFWGSDIDVSERLTALLDNNFDTLIISTDSYHQHFISLDQSVIPLIKEALSLCLQVKVIVSFDKNNKQFATVSRLRKMFQDRIDIKLRPVSPFGSAKINGIEISSLVQQSKLCNNAGNLCVRYDGECFICCGPPIVYEYKPYQLGNILTTSINGLTDNIIHNEICSYLPSVSNREGSTLCAECITHAKELDSMKKEEDP